MDPKKYILEKINSGPLFKHFERDYSVFFLSSINDAHTIANQPKYGHDGLTLTMMVYRDKISSYYRLEQDNEVYLKNIADNIAKDKSIKDEIFNGYTEVCEKMKGLYGQIDTKEHFEPAFIEELSEAINRLIPYQILIMHRADSFVKAFEKTPEMPDEIYAIRKKYEAVFGSFETKFELLCGKIIKSRSLNMTLEDFKYLTAEDITRVIKTSTRPDSLIEERKVGIIVNYLPSVEILTGSDAKEIFDAIHQNEEKYHPTENANSEVKGKTVFGTGKVTGKCRVIIDYDKIEDLEEGEILVAPSTLPKYNNVYKRAKAIITNEGGILAHASIFCREFKIPGIVGTKIGTKVFKNRDTIELDTDNGVVRIIK